ncbi:hypothetical protein BK011_02685 [Tenericutes bacterium MZ-XQ]|nr:hypothetical protein BK011_02685 [Tenericutes bacterium MZ-XQ]
MHNLIKKISVVFIVTLLLLGLPLISGYIADALFVEAIDPDGAFLWISIHHIAQMLMFIILILLIKKVKPEINFGFNFNEKKKGFKYVGFFTIGFLIYTAVGFGMTLISDSFVPYANDLNARNIFGYLGFQLLLSGPSEEILFRAFGITILGLVFKKRIFKDKLSVSNLIAAVIFGLAHVGIYFAPFELRYNLFQLIYAFALGLIYGDCYEKTGSVIYPMVIHSISNVIAVGVTMLLS